MTRQKLIKTEICLGDLIKVTLTQSGDYGLTFNLKTVVEDAKPMFSGHVDDCFAFDLRKLANRIDEMRKDQD